MQIDNGTIQTTVDGIETLSSLGNNGFVLFSIIIVALMFYLQWKEKREYLNMTIKNHNDNVERIEEAHDRIHVVEEYNKTCLKELKEMTSDMKKCSDEMKELLKGNQV